jgi:hypothetical protein
LPRKGVTDGEAMVVETGAVVVGRVGLAEAIEGVGQAAQALIGLQRQVAALARRAAADARTPPGAPALRARMRELLERVNAGSERMTQASAQLRRSWAASLAAEGLSRRQIAVELGVSHQRVSALLTPGNGVANPRAEIQAAHGGPASRPPGG